MEDLSSVEMHKYTEEQTGKAETRYKKHLVCVHHFTRFLTSLPPIYKCLFLPVTRRKTRKKCVLKMMARQSTVAFILLTTLLLRVCRSQPCSDDYLSSQSKVRERAFGTICEHLPEPPRTIALN